MRNKVFVTVFVVLSAVFIASSIFFDSVYTTMLTTAVAIFGGLAVYLQIHKEGKIAEGEFLHSLDESFKQGDTWLIAGKLFSVNEGLDEHGRYTLKVPLGESDIVPMMSYLTFFETLYLLIEEGVITMAEVDQLFRRRFFKATMNDYIQKHELVKHYYGYTNIYMLDLRWRTYLARRSSKGCDHLATIRKHGVPLKEAHEKYWSQPENQERWHCFETKCGEALCRTYEDVIRLGGGSVSKRQGREMAGW